MSESQFERLLGNASRMAIVAIGCVVVLVAMHLGQVILAPATFAVVVGLMFGPVADFLEKHGVPPALSAGLVVLLLIAVIIGGILLFAVPLADWISRAPALWQKLRTELMNLKEPLQSITAFQDQIKGVLGENRALEVTVEDGSTVTDMAMFFPALGAQIAIFLASLYFYVATREHIRVSVLSLCVTRRLRWRTAHVFRDVEVKVSRFLLTVSILNFGVGVAVALTMWALGVPSPLLWGALAGILNFIPYVGQAVMAVILLAVGLGTQTGLEHILLPVGCYLAINFVEGQIITPHFIGHTMTLNPFLIFLSIAFWLWAWGPIGGLIAVPLLLIMHSVLTHILASKAVVPRRPVQRTPRMTEKDLVLANAAAAIREQAEEAGENPKSAERKAKRLEPPAGTAPDGSAQKLPSL